MLAGLPSSLHQKSDHSNLITYAPGKRLWTDYVQSHPLGGIYHRWEWDQVFSCYGLTLVRIAAVNTDRIVGLVSFVAQRSMIFGSSLVSLPWFDTSGMLAEDSEAAQEMRDAALEYCRRRRIRQLFLREPEERTEWGTGASGKVLMRLRLYSDPDELWNSFAPKVRNQVRKAEKSGVVVNSGGSDLVREFHEVYSQNMRDLGSPGHSIQFFERILKVFHDEARLHVARQDGVAVGAGLTLKNGESLEIPWASSLKSHNKFCINHGMYWHILSEACKTGFRQFHFGRSTPGEGTHRFKKQWGSQEVPLFWYKFDSSGKPLASDEALQSKFGWATSLWTKLPLRVSRWIGPRLIRSVP